LKTPVTGGEKRHPFGVHPQGFLIYTDEGFMSAQRMKVPAIEQLRGDRQRRQ
jgi:hypothetical protein